MNSLARRHISKFAARLVSTSSTVAPSSLFLVHAPDNTGPGALERRLSVRPSHFASATPQHEEGTIQYAGAMLDAAGNMAGSMLVLRAASLDAAQKIIENDPYYKGKVWDKARLTIVPFRRAFPHTDVVP